MAEPVTNKGRFTEYVISVAGKYRTPHNYSICCHMINGCISTSMGFILFEKVCLIFNSFKGVQVKDYPISIHLKMKQFLTKNDCRGHKCQRVHMES